MSDPVDEAAEALYGAPLSAFTAERKRLADALKAAGSKASATGFAKLPRPSMSAWVVNQLWRVARGEMDALLAAGARVRDGDRDGLAEQRAVLAQLRTRAAAVLASDDHAASPGTIQRVATTLHALSALGWDPDPPGRLVEDRDPPGFEVMLGVPLEPAPATPKSPPPVDELAARRPRTDRSALEQAEKAEREKEERERATRARVRAAERALLERAVDGMRRAVVQRTAELANAVAEVQVAETALERARARVGEASRALADAEHRVANAVAALGEHDGEGG